jgi:RluA family pseudouridine synthase
MSQKPESKNPAPLKTLEILEILFRDTWLLAVNKRPGLPSQPTLDKKRANVFDLAKAQLDSKQVYLHHRLDKDTSGVILLAIHPAVNKNLTEMFREHRFEKSYWALTPPVSRIKTPSWEIQNHLVGRRQSQKLVKMFKTESGGDFAHTLFQRKQTYAEAELIEAKPLTGRTHQIRVHLQNSGAPILGDWLYGSKKYEPQGLPPPRLMLHARSLAFTHPMTGQAMTIEAPVPDDFQDYLSKLSRK